MSAARVLEALRARGVRVLSQGGRIGVFGPRSVLTPALLEALRPCKAALLEELAEEQYEREEREAIQWEAELTEAEATAAARG